MAKKCRGMPAGKASRSSSMQNQRTKPDPAGSGGKTNDEDGGHGVSGGEVPGRRGAVAVIAAKTNARSAWGEQRPDQGPRPGRRVRRRRPVGGNERRRDRHPGAAPPHLCEIIGGALPKSVSAISPENSAWP